MGEREHSSRACSRPPASPRPSGPARVVGPDSRKPAAPDKAETIRPPDGAGGR